MTEAGSVALRRLLSEQAPAVLASHEDLGDATATLLPETLVEVMTWLRDERGLEFEMLMDLTAVDYLEQGRTPRFEVVHHLYSVACGHRLRVKLPVAADAAEVPSLCEVWPSANWMEREVWDLYGIRFSGHPDLRRILLYEEFEGHPLRKDYPKKRRQPLPGGEA